MFQWRANWTWASWAPLWHDGESMLDCIRQKIASSSRHVILTFKLVLMRPSTIWSTWSRFGFPCEKKRHGFARVCSLLYSLIVMIIKDFPYVVKFLISGTGSDLSPDHRQQKDCSQSDSFFQSYSFSVPKMSRMLNVLSTWYFANLKSSNLYVVESDIKPTLRWNKHFIKKA